MVKKGPLRSLSVVVDPSHKLIVDESDNRPQTGRLVLEGAPQQRPLIPPSPAPGASFNATVMTDRDAIPASKKLTLSIGRRLGKQLAAASSQGATDAEMTSPDGAPAPLPSAPSEPADRSTMSSPEVCLLPPTTSFASSLAARRRSSVVSLPPLPTAAAPPSSATTTPLLHIPTRARNDSNTSMNSVVQSQNSRATPDLTREDSSRFTYLNSAASSISNTALNSITMPAPYRNGPIQVLPGIWLGCEDNARDWEGLRRCGIGSVLNVAKEITNLFEDGTAASSGTSTDQNQTLAPSSLRIRSSTSAPNLSKAPPRLTFGSRLTPVKPTANLLPADALTGRPELYYLHLPWSHGQSDLVGNGPSGFAQAMQFCDEAVQRGKGVLVHCQCGVSRSATMAIALVMRAAARTDATDELKALGPGMNAAYDYVKQKSSCVGPNMSLIYQLLDYEKQLHPRPAVLSRTTSYQGYSDASGQSEPANSPDEPNRYTSEEDRIKEEEEEWARMRKQMEEEEEREREESLREAGAGPLARPDSGFGGRPVLGEALQVPWNNAWSGFSLPLSNGGGGGGTSRGTRSVADDEEAKGLDLAMEQRQLRRKSSALSVASSSRASSGGKGADHVGSSNSGARATESMSTPYATWKARFGHGRRLRAGSVESNVTGNSISMISVEEEDEALEADRTLSPQASRLLATSSSINNNTAGNSRVGLAPVVRPRVISDVSADSKSSDSASASETSLSDAASPNMDEDEDGEQFLTAPPLSAEGTTSSAMVLTPLTPVSLDSRKKNNGGRFKPMLNVTSSSELSGEPQAGDDGFQSFRIVVEEATPLASRAKQTASFNNNDSTEEEEETHASPTHFHSRPTPTRSMTSPTFGFGNIPTIGRRSSQQLPPPSASAFKTSFSMDDDHVPPRSASHMKTSFGSDQDRSFPRRPSSVSSRSARSNQRSKSPTFTFPLKRNRSRQNESALQTVPGSPPAMEDVRNTSSRMEDVTMTEPSPTSHMIFLGTSKRFVEDPEPILPVDDGRKRSKSKPQPLSIQSNQDTTSSSALAAYVLSSSKRGHRTGKSMSSSTSCSSRSSVTSRSSLRDQLLSRIARSGTSPPPRSVSPALATATPHQTLFIFPPSPNHSPTKNNHAPSLPSSTPSAFMLTTNFGPADGSSPFSPTSLPLLTPTPTLATFVSTGRRASTNLSRKSSVSSISSTNMSSGWMGAMPPAPTTACSRVDARGWVAR
ncbi:hypothetical protein FRB96_004827 [Tulasnella sp. 330]|nr:hypothetical protein FRB96_004827 [Tulasnella sp. 330]